MPDGIQLTKRRVAKQGLWPHQVGAVDSLTQALTESNRATLVMACGTGKTLVSIHLADRILPHRGGLIVVLCPSLGLIWQTEKQWREQWLGVGYRLLVVCSDKPGTDEIRPEAAELNYDVTTRPDDVKTFLQHNRDVNTSVIFVTYHSAPIVGEALLSVGRTAAVAIFDEAHRTAGGIDKAFGYALKDERFPADKRLFMTATPRIAKRWQKRVTRSGDEEYPVVSMDNPAIYGTEAARYTFKRAADDGIICGYRVLISVVKKSELRGIMPEDHEAALIALKKTMAHVGAKKVISYHASIADAEAFAEEAPRYLNDLTVVHVNGNQPGGQRRANMDVFARADRALATNMRCLTEGIDVPDVDMVAFMAPKNSSIDIVQAMGRAMRIHDGKTMGYVLVPLLLDVESEEAIDDAVKRKKMDTAWRVISSLMDEDPSFAATVSVRRRRKSQNPTTGMLPLGGDVFSSPPGGALTATGSGSGPDSGGQGSHEIWPVEVVGAESKWATLQAAIDVRIINRLSEGWDEGFGLLEKFVAEHGTSKLPNSRKNLTRLSQEEINLSRWMQTQRYRKSVGSLSSERVARLEALPGWSWRHVRDDNWNGMFRLLTSYVLKHGSANVPVDYCEGKERLGRWVASQRRQRGLYTKRDQQLESLPGWSWNLLEDKWDSWFALYLRYVDRTGSSRITNHHVEEKDNLGLWVFNQRLAYKQNSLSTERAIKLEALPNWTWTPRLSQKKKIAQKKKDKVGVRVCSQCSAAQPLAPVCFECQHMYEDDQRSISEIYDDVCKKSGYRRGYERPYQFMRRIGISETTYLRWRKLGFPITNDGWICPTKADYFINMLSRRELKKVPPGFESRTSFARRIGSITRTVRKMVDRGLPCDCDSKSINIKEGLKWVGKNELDRFKLVKKSKRGPLMDHHLYERITDFARRIGVSPTTISQAIERGIPHDAESRWLKIKEAEAWFKQNCKKGVALPSKIKRKPSNKDRKFNCLTGQP